MHAWKFTPNFLVACFASLLSVLMSMLLDVQAFVEGKFSASAVGYQRPSPPSAGSAWSSDRAGSPAIPTMGAVHLLRTPLDALTFYTPELRRRLWFLLSTLERQAAGPPPHPFPPPMQAFIGARCSPLLLCRCLSSRLALIAAPVAMEWPALPVLHRRNFVSVPA